MHYVPRLLAALLLVLPLSGFAPVPGPETAPDRATWSIDKVHSRVGFKVRHLGISFVRGAFQDYEATLSFDPADLTTLETTATIQTTSVNTENERRDNDLRSERLFNVEAYPTMTFESTGIRSVEGDEFEIVGNLTLKDVTKEVVLEATFLGTTMNRGQERAGFEAETTIDRFDYNVAWDALTEAGNLIVGREVQIIIELEVIREDA